MKSIQTLALALPLFLACEPKTTRKTVEFPTHFELTQGEESATYLQAIDFYIQLAKEFPEINIQTMGETDSGHPLHMVTFNKDGDFNFQKIGKNKTLILINNGIHPGESDGIDATMLLFRDLATGKLPTPVNTVLVTIPVYNIGGALNRNSTTRANQNGPKAYGFRGNAKNYDLNRDFIKADTKNAQTFAGIFHLVKPDIFIDNHVSNGADYQYTLTHLLTQHNKLGGELGTYLHDGLMPKLETALQKANFGITPYVNVFNEVPETGFSQFIDHPRYSTGYAALWNSLGMMVETHMLKPYAQRVEGTYQLMAKMIDIAEEDHLKIKQMRQNAESQHLNWTYYPTNWQVDSAKTSRLEFKGYEANKTLSAITGMPRLKYDRSKPFTKDVVYYNYFKPVDSILIPDAYIIKKSWGHLAGHLTANKIKFQTLASDTVFNVEAYKIKNFKTRDAPFEGHYLHYGTQVERYLGKVLFEAGDLVIPTDQPGIKYILETLEPEAIDSFFNWNFFDTILQQKEGFSPYVFEDVALEMLENDASLKEYFELKKASDTLFAKNWYAQLEWLYKKSPHYEAAHMQYPVYRVLK